MRPLLLILALALVVGSSHAGGQPSPPFQPPATLPPPPAVSAKNGAIVLSLGSFRAFKPEGRKTPTDIHVLHGPILGARPSPTDPTALVLTGKEVGSTTLTITYEDKTKESYEVAVEPVRYDLTKRVRPGFVVVTIGLAAENAVGGYLGLNDYVEVYVTKGPDTEKKTVTLMKNIRVLSVPYGTEARLVVTLEVTTEEAKLLRTAVESGTVALGLLPTPDEKMLQDRKGDDTPKK